MPEEKLLGIGVYKEFEDVMRFMVDDMCKAEQLKGSYQGTEQWCMQQMCRLDMHG